MVKIVITGGPSSGKTTVLNALKSTENYIVFDEIARRLIEGGLPSDDRSFQLQVLANQLDEEEKLISELSTSDDAVILFDRGALDGSAYLTDERWNGIMKSLSVTEKELSERYDAVIYLDSDESHYVQDSARGEDFETAYALGRRVFEKYSAYFDVHSVGQTTHIDEKIKLVSDEIRKIIFEINT